MRVALQETEKDPERHRKTEAEIGGMCLQAKKSQGAGGKLGERHGRNYPCEPPKGTNPVDTLILNFQPPELGEDIFLLF